MSRSLGPLDCAGRVPPPQQTRVPAFLISAHGALARQFAFALPARLTSARQIEVHAQSYREAEIVSLLLRATAWVPDLALGSMAASWGTAWFPKPIEGIADRFLALTVDLATRAHAIHARIRPAALLPLEVDAHDPFVVALRRIEFESSRLLQAQIILLKDADLAPFRDVVSSALEQRHAEVRKLWSEMLQSVGLSVDDRNGQES
jgi:hypothetical protein